MCSAVQVGSGEPTPLTKEDRTRSGVAVRDCVGLDGGVEFITNIQWNQPLWISGDILLSLGKDGGIWGYRKPQRIPDVGATKYYFGWERSEQLNISHDLARTRRCGVQGGSSGTRSPKGGFSTQRKKMVLIAAVGSGSISFFGFSQGKFGEWTMA
ncbi:hypothetical protein BKA70DRAFT_1219653 [Coprinopsis sp. MPI-PUGE-AT-0042]|nr:hypothetical protein BKA70DRAFT_1219653 [Coprinopsis sp. MPI-PUGE-AT-0042]